MKMLHTIRSPIIRQYVVVITVNLALLCTGLALAWSSPMLVKLRSSDTVLDEPLTEEDGSWVVSVGFLAAPMAMFLPVLLVDRLGRKYTILTGVFPKLAAALFVLFSKNVRMLLVGRALNGVSDAFIFTIVPTYASEIASKEVRGSLSTIVQIMCSLGNVIMLSVGPFASYFAGNVMLVVIIVAALLPLPFLPESPYFLYKKEKRKEAVEILTLLRGSEAAANEEIKEYDILNADEKANKLDLFKNKIFWKSLFLISVFSFGTQIIGFQAVAFYLQTILESTHTSVKPELASVTIGVIQLIASLCVSIITDKFGRKPIVSTSLMGMMAGMICLGVFFYFTEGAEVIKGFMNFLPLIALILVVFCFSAGCGSIIWAISAELFDGNGRAVGIALSMVLSNLSTFLLARLFPSIVMAIGSAATYWTFSVNCFLLCAFVMACIPETKGKSFVEIQQALGASIVIDEENGL